MKQFSIEQSTYDSGNFVVQIIAAWRAPSFIRPLPFTTIIEQGHQQVMKNIDSSKWYNNPCPACFTCLIFKNDKISPFSRSDIRRYSSLFSRPWFLHVRLHVGPNNRERCLSFWVRLVSLVTTIVCRSLTVVCGFYGTVFSLVPI